MAPALKAGTWQPFIWDAACARLKQPTRMTRPPRKRAGTLARPRVIPIRSCSRWGLPCHPCCHARAVGSYPTFSPLPAEGAGGLFSVALSLGSPPPDVIRHRVSVEPGLSSPRIAFRHLCRARLPSQLAGAALAHDEGKPGKAQRQFRLKTCAAVLTSISMRYQRNKRRNRPRIRPSID